MKQMLALVGGAEMYVPINERLGNEGLFANGTNPVDGVESILLETSIPSTVTTANITAFAYEVVLAPGNTGINIYFRAENSAVVPSNISVSRAGEVKSAVVYKYTGSENYTHYIEIKNIGPALWNSVYTVSIPDGNESASVSISVLKYLSNVLSHSTTTDEQKNTARAMYQYYCLATGIVTPENCQHDGHLHEVISSGAVCKACSSCHTLVEAISPPVISEDKWIDHGEIAPRFE